MPLLLRVAFVLIGLFAIGTSFWLQHMNSKAASWPATDGEITWSALVDDPHDAGTWVEISYRYAVGGRTYSSSQVSYGLMSSALHAKKRLVAAYPVGKRVSVYYDPDNPAAAVLRREENSRWLLLAATGTFFSLVGLLSH